MKTDSTNLSQAQLKIIEQIILAGRTPETTQGIRATAEIEMKPTLEKENNND